jgi:hypothetical protein
MKYLARAVIFLALLLTCCVSPPHSRTPVKHDAPRVAWTFHGDVEFTPEERALVMKAIAALEYQTAGLYSLRVEWDLDYDNVITLSVLKDQPLIVRMSSDFDVIRAIDEMAGGHVLGVTLPHGTNNLGPPQVYLVVDRLDTPARFQHVAMHELLHAAGLDDVDSSGSVMSGAVCHMSAGMMSCEDVLCMSPMDAAEFCRVNHCKVDELNTCAWGT